MNIRRKLFIGFGLLLFILLSSGLLGVWVINQQNNLFEKTIQEDHQFVTVSKDISESMLLHRRYEKDFFINTGAPDKQAGYKEKLLKETERMKGLIVQINKLTEADSDLSPEEKTKVKALQAYYDLYLEGILSVMGRMESDQTITTQAANARMGEYKKAIHALEIDINEIAQVGEKMMAMVSKESVTQSSRYRFLILMVVIGGIGLGILLAFMMSREVNGPLSKLLGYAQTVRDGKLDEQLTLQQRDEFGALAECLRSMVESLKQKIAEADQKSKQAEAESGKALQATQEAQEAKTRAERAKAEGMLQAANTLETIVERLNVATEEMSAQAEEMRTGAHTQTDRIQGTATAMNEMNATVLEVAKNAGNAAEESEKTKVFAEQGSDVIRRSMEAMTNVQQQAGKLKGNMQDLGDKAKAIGSILSVINDIADQTNLLALNAAIEAARAGDAGRGFAVVADEVRKLAEKTMTATKEVGLSISAIQGVAAENISSVEKAVTDITASAQLSTQSSSVLTSIVQSAEASAGQVRSIATAAEEQSAASEEISHSIEEISSIAENTGQGIDESVAALQEVARQAADLRRLISEMKQENISMKTSAREERFQERTVAPVVVSKRPSMSRPEAAPAARPSVSANPPDRGGEYFPWKPEYSVGVEFTDGQHKVLVAMINDLYEAMKGGRGKDAVGQVLSDLVEYTKTHFSDEEALLERHKYSGLLNHKKIHQTFIQQVLDAEAKFKKGQASVAVEISKLLRDWLINHIMATDKKYGEWLNARGIH